MTKWNGMDDIYVYDYIDERGTNVQPSIITEDFEILFNRKLTIWECRMFNIAVSHLGTNIQIINQDGYKLFILMKDVSEMFGIKRPSAAKGVEKFIASATEIKMRISYKDGREHTGRLFEGVERVLGALFLELNKEI